MNSNVKKSNKHLSSTIKAWSKLPIYTVMLGLIALSLFLYPEGTSSTPLPEQELFIELDNSWETKFHEQITTWVSEIGRKGEQFEDWLDAKYETYPLGPGSRQWVVIIHNNNQEIGYLIMEQIDEEPLFSLIEYGRSDDAVLSKELQENPYFLMDDFFYSGLLWAKFEENCLVDLITTEKYEHVSLRNADPNWTGQSVNSLLNERNNVDLSNTAPIVFLSDALVESNTISPADLQEAERYFYRARLLPEVTGLYNVLSIHTWSDLNNSESKRLFIGLEDEGIRYFSSAYLEELGTFERIN